MKCFIKGQWVSSADQIDVLNPYDQSVIDHVPSLNSTDVDEAIGSAVAGAETIGKLSGYDRSVMLRKAAELMKNRIGDLAETISREEGKSLKESKNETWRAIETLELCAEEARRLSGKVLPLDGARGARNQFGFTMRVPCGVVAAITPFNFPLNLVCHKVGPALAGGNSVLIKPASDTPLSSLKLTEILLEAGCPDQAISCLTGSGSTIGAQLCQDKRIRKISFTGSKEVGEAICKMAGLKRVTMELGSNCPVVVLPDADIEKVVSSLAVSGFANAGQVCISAQRVVVHADIEHELLDRLIKRVDRMSAGDPFDQAYDIGPMVRESDAARVESWIDEAIEQGAQLVCGGERNQSLVQPAILRNVNRNMRIVKEELFGPAIGILSATTVEDAIQQANDSPYGLSASIFTQDIDSAMRFARQMDSGNIHINWGPMWRADSMPYGGLKDSGFGKEGPQYAIEEMTEMKAVVIH